MNESNNLQLPYIMPSQAQKHVTHNEAIRMLDVVVQLSVIEKDLASPPGFVSEGDRYLIGQNPTGEFSDHAQKVAVFQDGTWAFMSPRIGWISFVAEENQAYFFDGENWAPLYTESESSTQFAINATADEANKFAVKSDNVYFSHDDVTPGSGDVRFSINKSQNMNTASLLFKSDWIGCAEMGLAGSNNFQIKVSSDGNTWHEAMTIAAESGSISYGIGGHHKFGHDNHAAGLNIVPNVDDPSNVVDGDIWYNSTLGKFRKRESGIVSDLGSHSGGTSDGPAGGINLLQFNDNGSFGAATALYYDAINQRLGFGTHTPIQQLDISENLNFPATDANVGTIYQAGTRFLHSFGVNNIFLGQSAGNYNLTGVSNVAMGRLSLSNLTTGSANLSFGDLALRFLTSGQQNIAIGSSALTGLTTGRFNISIGTNSLKTITSTNGNVAIGYNAMVNSTSGNNCVAIGFQAGAQVTTGVNNTFIGRKSGDGVVTGSHNTIVGPAENLDPGLSNTIILADGQGNQRIEATSLGATVDGFVKPKVYLVATVPSATVAGEGAFIFVSDEVGGPTPAFSDGVNWRRMSDRAVIS